LLNPLDYPVTAVCLACGRPIRVERMMYSEWKHTGMGETRRRTSTDGPFSPATTGDWTFRTREVGARWLAGPGRDCAQFPMKIDDKAALAIYKIVKAELEQQGS
jgi:hypothetical protein